MVPCSQTCFSQPKWTFLLFFVYQKNWSYFCGYNNLSSKLLLYCLFLKCLLEALMTRPIVCNAVKNKDSLFSYTCQATNIHTPYVFLNIYYQSQVQTVLWKKNIFLNWMKIYLVIFKHFMIIIFNITKQTLYLEKKWNQRCFLKRTTKMLRNQQI